MKTTFIRIGQRHCLALGLCLQLAACGALPDLHPESRQNSSDLRLADAARDSGNLDMAVSLYKKILQRNPDEKAALTGLAGTLAQSNELQQARQIYLHLQTLAPHQLDAELGLARISVRQQQLDDARTRYQEILSRQPDNLQALAGLGVVYDMQGQHDAAQQIYRQALSRYPDDLNLRNDLGLSLILAQQLRTGIAELLKIVDVPSAPAQARQNLALGYGLLGNEAAAERVLQADMPSAQIQNNLRYYRELRARLGKKEPSDSPASGTHKKRQRRK